MEEGPQTSPPCLCCSPTDPGRQWAKGELRAVSSLSKAWCRAGGNFVTPCLVAPRADGPPSPHHGMPLLSIISCYLNVFRDPELSSFHALNCATSFWEAFCKCSAQVMTPVKLTWLSQSIRACQRILLWPRGDLDFWNLEQIPDSPLGVERNPAREKIRVCMEQFLVPNERFCPILF